MKLVITAERQENRRSMAVKVETELFSGAPATILPGNLTEKERRLLQKVLDTDAQIKEEELR